MPRPTASELATSRYPFVCELATRFGDLDTNMHVNNAAMVGLLEEARVRFHTTNGFREALQAADETPAPDAKRRPDETELYDATGKRGAMVASLAVEYLAQAYYPEPLTVHAGAADIGRSSYRLDLLVTQGGRATCFARAVMVCVAGGRSTPWPAAFVESVKPWMIRT